MRRVLKCRFAYDGAMLFWLHLHHKQYTDHTYTSSWSCLHFNARQTQTMPPSLTLHVHSVIFVPSPLQRQRDAHATITTSITRTRCYLGSVSISVERQADTDDAITENHTPTVLSWSRLHLNTRETQTTRIATSITYTQSYLSPVSI